MGKPLKVRVDIDISTERQKVLTAVREASKDPVPARSDLLRLRRQVTNALIGIQRKTQMTVFMANQRVIAEKGFVRGAPQLGGPRYRFRGQAKPGDVIQPAFTRLERVITDLKVELRSDNFNAVKTRRLSYEAMMLQEEIFKFSYGAIVYALMAWEIDPTSKGVEAKLPKDGNPAQVHNSRLQGPLFAKQAGDSHRVSANDVHQGYIGDCYFMATMAAVAQTDPDKIVQMTKYNQDGTYTVTFRSWITKGPTEVRVSDHVLQYVNGTGPYYGRGRGAPAGGMEKWPVIMERAYAKWQGGYDDTSNSEATFGTSTGSAMSRFGPTDTHTGFTAAGALKILEEAERKKWPISVAAGSWDEPEGFRESARTFLRGEWADWRKKRQDAATRLKVAADNHVYTFIGIQNNKIVLRNPWGHRHPDPMTAEEFVLFFDEIVVGKF